MVPLGFSRTGDMHVVVLFFDGGSPRARARVECSTVVARKSRRVGDESEGAMTMKLRVISVGEVSQEHRNVDPEQGEQGGAPASSRNGRWV